MNFPGRLIAGLLIVVLLLIFPLQYIAESNSEDIDTLIDGRTKMLTDTIRDKGYLDKQMFESYVDYLDTTGERYDIELQDIRPVTGEEISGLGVNNNLMSTSTNENISASLMSTNELQSFATHTHTNACYAGDLHVCDDINCEYENDIPTEILLHTRLRTTFSSDIEDKHYILYSNNGGETWTRRTAPRYFGAGGYENITYGKDGFYYLAWDREDVDYATTYLNKYNPLTGGSTRISSLATKGGSRTGYRNLMYINDRFFATHYKRNSWNDFIIYSTDDGKTYDNTNLIVTRAEGSNIVYGNGVYVENEMIYSNSDGYYNSQLYSSPDGINWTKRIDNKNNRIAVIYAGDRFIYGDSKGTLYYSYDGINWGRLGPRLGRPEVGSNYCTNAMNIAYGNGLLIVNDSGKLYITSNYGQSYTYKNIGTCYNIKYSDGFFYSYTSPGYGSSLFKEINLQKSRDGITWTKIETPLSNVSYEYYERIQSITFNSDSSTGEVDRGQCIKKGKYYDSKENEVKPICNQVVTSISATPSTQTVDKGKPISLTVRATYLDGHSATITNYTTNYNPNKVGTQTVTITYSGLVGNAKTNGTRTCTVKVTVRETNIPSYLTVVPSATTVYNGNEPTYTVSVTYTSGVTKSLTSSQYSKTGWSSGTGTKNLTFSYTENGKTVSKKITIIVLAWLSSITVTPSPCEIERYTNPAFTVRANFANGSSQIVTGYTMRGLDNTRIGTQTVTITYKHTNSETKSADIKVTVTALKKECPRCHETYELNYDDTDPGCPYCISTIIGIEVDPDYVEVSKGQSLPIKVMAVFKNGQRAQVSSWTSNYNSARLGIQKVTVEYGGYAKEITVWIDDEMITCPICNTEYPKSEGSCPVCAEKVISISVSPNEITVMQYETIPLTVTAHFADGASRIVDGWSIDTSTVNPGTYKATISYKGVTDTITLHVLPITSIECPICSTIYDLIENPTGCPVCSRELIGIEAYLTSGTNLVQLGTNPSIAVILIFRDEHREFATDGYTIEDYDSGVLGIQTITVRYKGFATTLVIEVVNMLDNITCPNGHVYHKNQDGTDPGCPFCHEGEDIGKIIYFDITYTGEILDSIYSIGAYYFNEGNYITVIVTKKDKSLLYKLQDTFFSTSLLGRKRRYIYGGEVY